MTPINREIILGQADRRRGGMQTPPLLPLRSEFDSNVPRIPEIDMRVANGSLLARDAPNYGRSITFPYEKDIR